MLWGWKSHGEARGRVGVAIDVDGFALVHVVETGARPALEVCEYVHFEGEDEFALALSGTVREHGLVGVRAAAVLPADAYVMRPIDAPEVPEDELRDAVRWALRDQLPFDPADAVVDVMSIPAMSHESTRRVFAVAAESANVDRIVGVLRESGLEPASVEIRETALLNLAPWVGDPAQGQAFLRLAPKRSRFGVARDGELCMARDLATDLSVLETDAEEPGPELDNLLLEVQRSLDYFESNFGRVPAQRLWVLPSPFELGSFVRYLSENTPLPVAQLDLSTLVDSTVPMPQALQDQVLAAFSAALRPADAEHLEMWNPQLAVPPPPLSSEAMLKAGGVFAAGLLAVALAGSWQNGRTAEVLARVEAQATAEAARVERLEARAARGPDAVLGHEIETLRAERARKTRVLAALLGGGLGERTGFADTLEALSRRDSDDVWLQRIELREGGRALAFAGGATRPEAVPTWLSGLRGEPTFAGRSFRSFEILPPADASGGVRFSLDSDRPEGSSS
jgi:MSHA biogenesis protein MshI